MEYILLGVAYGIITFGLVWFLRDLKKEMKKFDEYDMSIFENSKIDYPEEEKKVILEILNKMNKKKID